MRLGEMVGIQRDAVAGQLAQNRGASPARMLEGLEGNHGGAFPDGQAIAARVEGTADAGRKRLQRIEARENQQAKGIVPAGEGALGLAAANEFPAVPDGIGARRAGIGNDRNRAP